MKLPWIRLPTSAGRGTETPTSKPSMIRPRRMLLGRVEHEARGPARSGCRRRSRGPVALLPSRAAILFGVDVIWTGVGELCSCV